MHARTHIFVLEIKLNFVGEKDVLPTAGRMVMIENVQSGLYDRRAFILAKELNFYLCVRK